MTDSNLEIDHIFRQFGGTPTIVDAPIKENCKFDNTAGIGYATMIIDKNFIDDMLKIKNGINPNDNFIKNLTIIQREILNYFNSPEIYKESRERFYSSNEGVILDEEGAVIGTKISASKGKNIAKCSEKSIASYIILDSLYREGKITKKPSLVLSSLSTDSIPSNPHAFIILDDEKKDYPAKYLLFDPENLTCLENENKERSYTVGIYSLTDEQREDIVNGNKCIPISLYEASNTNYHDIGEKRIYGSMKKINKSK